jgi:hypothetical protein
MCIYGSGVVIHARGTKLFDTIGELEVLKAIGPQTLVEPPDRPGERRRQ